MIDITTEEDLGPIWCYGCDKEFTENEEEIVCRLHRNSDNKWVYVCWHRECLRQELIFIGCPEFPLSFYF